MGFVLHAQVVLCCDLAEIIFCSCAFGKYAWVSRPGQCSRSIVPNGFCQCGKSVCSLFELLCLNSPPFNLTKDVLKALIQCRLLFTSQTKTVFESALYNFTITVRLKEHFHAFAACCSTDTAG